MQLYSECLYCMFEHHWSLVRDHPDEARKAAHEANPLYPVPVLMDARELENFYYMVMEDRAHGRVHTGGAA